MSARLVVRPQATAELVAARDWFEAQRPGLGQEFVLEVDATMSEVLTRRSFTVKCDGPSFIVSLTACSFESSPTPSSFSASSMDVGIQKAGGTDCEV